MKINPSIIIRVYLTLIYFWGIRIRLSKGSLVVMDGNKVDGSCFLQRSTVTDLADVSHSTNIRLLPMLVKQIEEEEHFMLHVPYSNVFGSIMCVMVRIRPNISHAFSVVSTNKVYWLVVKLILRCL
jgi:hypothetical protein